MPQTEKPQFKPSKTRRCLYLRDATRSRMRALMYLLSNERDISGMSELVDVAVEFMYNAYTGQAARQ